ncbi:MAG: Rossmann-like and DUF2520 domain-containing protein [Candidatus Aminicenantaceae bacterium]
MTTVSILGAGKLGTALGTALRRSGYQIRGLTCLTQSSAQESRQIIGSGNPLTDNREAAAGSQVVFLTVPDDAIRGVAEDLASGGRDWTGVFCLHCSGLLSSEILAPLAKRGALTASFHPMQSFASKQARPESFAGIHVGLEGEPRARKKAQTIVEDLGSQPFILAAKDKPLYHTACSMASNLLVPLLHHASILLQNTGIARPDQVEALLPLVKGTLRNVKNFDTKGSLTGPLARGDEKSVTLQIEALQGYPRALRIYRELSIAALEMARTEREINEQEYRRIRALLEGK